MLPVYYFLGKFALYALVCSWAIPMLGLSVPSKAGFALKWAAIRFAMGLLFGYIIYMIFAITHSVHVPEAIGYILSFLLVRVVEWRLLFALMARRHELSFGSRGKAWVALGVIATLFSDWAAVGIGMTHIIRC